MISGTTAAEVEQESNVTVVPRPRKRCTLGAKSRLTSSSWPTDKTFQNFAERNAREAAIARIERLSTVFDLRDQSRTQGIGNAWSQAHYGGDFGLAVADEGQTALSLVFVQSKDGNTGGHRSQHPRRWGDGQVPDL